MRCSSFIAVVLHGIPLLMVQGKGNNGKKRKHKYNIPKVYINGFSGKYFLKFFFFLSRFFHCLIRGALLFCGFSQKESFYSLIFSLFLGFYLAFQCFHGSNLGHHLKIYFQPSILYHM